MIMALHRIEDDRIAGDIVEVGVWRGGNIMLAKKMCPLRRCWLYDTFDGMTMPTKLDCKPGNKYAINWYYKKHTNGKKWNAASLEEVQRNFADLKIDQHGLVFVRGPAEETLRSSMKPKAIAILRLDVDWYIPTKMALETLYPLLSPGGYLIIDDYGHWLGCQKAVDDYFGKHAPPSLDVDYSCRVFLC
jgi:hypothetical protein